MQRQLSKFMLPGPLSYCAKTDSMLTYNSQMEVPRYSRDTRRDAPRCAEIQPRCAEIGAPTVRLRAQVDCYRFASVTEGRGGTSKKLVADWSVVVGEHVHAISSARFSKALAASQVRRLT